MIGALEKWQSNGRWGNRISLLNDISVKYGISNGGKRNVNTKPDTPCITWLWGQWSIGEIEFRLLKSLFSDSKVETNAEDGNINNFPVAVPQLTNTVNDLSMNSDHFEFHFCCARAYASVQFSESVHRRANHPLLARRLGVKIFFLLEHETIVNNSQL